MPTDDEILVRVQRRATVLRRRQRALVAGTAMAAIVALLGGAVLAGAGRDGRDPVDVAADPTDPVGTTVPTTTGDAGELACTPTTTDRDLGTATAGPGGSPSAPTDGSGSEASSTPSTTADPLPAHGEPAGASPAESSSPDDPPATTLPTVEASSTACPLQVRVTATYDPATRAVALVVAATAEPLYDAHGFVVWDSADPVQVDLGTIERDRGSCDADTSGAIDAAGDPLRGDFTAAHTYPDAGAKEVTVEFWARRCGGPVHQVEVTVTVPL